MARSAKGSAIAGGPRLGAALDALQHPAVHGEAHRLHERGPEGEPRHEVVRAVGAIAAQEPATPGSEGLHEEEPRRGHPGLARGARALIRRMGDEATPGEDLDHRERWRIGM